GRSQDVCRPHKTETHLRTQLLALFKGDGLKVGQAIQRFLEGVQRQCGIVLRLVMLVIERRVFFLQMAGIRKQNSAQVYGGRSRVDPSPKTLLNQARNPSAVVEVRMSEDHRVNISGRNRRWLPVSFSPLFRPLEQAAVDQDLKSILPAPIGSGVDQVLGTGHGAGCAQKL